MSSEPIAIFVATMTGVAEMCAEEIATTLSAAGIATETRLMDGLGVDALAGVSTIIIVSSTYGQGDIPDNGQAFYEAIDAGGDLTGRSYAVFGLGDRTYASTFCEAGKKWDSLFEAKGAQRFAALERHDASSGTLAEDVAAGWASGWVPSLQLAA